jgi:uncharacterized cupredoxin-like copper-binding protein
MKPYFLTAYLVLALPSLALAGPDAPTHTHMMSADKAMPADHAHMHDDDHGHQHDMSDTPFGKPGNPKAKSRTINLTMVEGNGTMAFEPNMIMIKTGEQVRFNIINKGALDHEFMLATLEMNLQHAEDMKKNTAMEHDDPNGRRIASGQTGEIIWLFNKAGNFDYSCLIPGHREAGMTGQIVVQ